MEGHGLALESGRRRTGFIRVRRLVTQLNVTTVEVDIASGRFRLVGTAFADVKVILQLKL